MTEKKTKIKHKTQPEASAKEKPEEKEQMATQPMEETEAVVLDDRDSPKTGALMGAAKAIEERVGSVREKAPEVVSVVLHKVKNGVSVAYGTSSTLVRDAYHAASEYADKQKHKINAKKLTAQREATSAKLGSIIYTRIIIDGEPPEKAFSDQEISLLLQQMQDLDNEVAEIGKELEKY